MRKFAFLHLMRLWYILPASRGLGPGLRASWRSAMAAEGEPGRKGEAFGPHDKEKAICQPYKNPRQSVGKRLTFCRPGPYLNQG